MIDFLTFADREVKQKLFARVTRAEKLVMVTTVPPHRAAAAKAKKEPFGSLERDFGDVFDQVLVVDEGTAEGMWRDPVTDLADAIYASDSEAAYQAAAGYFFVQAGVGRAIVKRVGAPEDDAWMIQDALSKLSRKVPAPDPAKKPGKGKKQAAAAPVAPKGPPKDPYAVLGLPDGASLDEAKKAWRALIVQYHPDKVAHLAPEFRSLAETRTREIMEAWQQLQDELG